MSLNQQDIALYVNGNNNIIQKYNIKNVKITALELNTFQKNIKKFIENKNIITNIYRIQAYNLINVWIFLYWIY